MTANDKVLMNAMLAYEYFLKKDFSGWGVTQDTLVTNVATEPPLAVPDYGYVTEPVTNADPNLMDWNALFRADAEKRREQYKRR